jgi:nicotinamide mononucleotide transporter
MAISQWIPECVGAMLTIWCVYLATQNKITNWPISILASIVYFYIFYQIRFFSDAYLQIVFVLFQLYGWWFWSKLNPSKQLQQISKINRKSTLFVALISLLLYGIWLYFYKIINPTARIPEIDALTTIISLTALYMQAKRWIENWIIWVIVDTIYVPMYIYGKQYITACLYGFLIIMAIYGFKEWQKQMTLDHSNKA